MDLKELLGEELYNQVMAKVGDHKLAVISDGSYIPKAKFDDVNSQLKDYKSQLADRDKQLLELGEKTKGNEDLTKQIDDLKKLNETTTQEYQQKLDKQAFDHALDRALGNAKVKNTKAVKALLDHDTIKLDGDSLKGLDDQLKNLQESDPYLFGEIEPGGTGGSKGNGGKGGKGQVDLGQQVAEQRNQVKQSSNNFWK